MLKIRGFSDDEIFFEKIIRLKKLPNNCWEYLRLDVVGIKKGKKIVIECGRFDSWYHPNKRQILEKKGFEIIHLPYHKSRPKTPFN